MAITIDPATFVISIPQSFLTLVSGILWDLDVNAFRLALKEITASEFGIPLLDTHKHNTEVVLSGVTYARSVEIINGYTVTFQNTGSPYTVQASGANHNIADVTNYTSNVSIIIGNSAGLITVAGGGASTTEILDMIVEAGIDFQAVLQVLLAVAAGKTSIAATTVTFRDQADTKDRVTATMLGSERTAIVLDPD